MNRSSEAQARPSFNFSRWKALPGMAVYYLIGSLIFPAAFVASQVGLEWQHPTSTRPAPDSPLATQPAPTSPAVPDRSTEDNILLRAEIGKAVREAMKEENASLKRQLATISAQLTMAELDRSFFAGVDRRLGTYDNLNQFAMLDRGTKGDLTPTYVPNEQGQKADVGTYDPQIFDKLRSYFPPTPSVTVKLKGGKTVTITSSDPTTLKEVQDKLAGQ